MVSLKGIRSPRPFLWAGRHLHRLPTAWVARAVGWGLPLLGLELLGRRSPTDAVDAIGVLGLGLLVLAAWIRFEGPVRRRLGLGLGTRLRRRLGRLRPRIGLDFRRHPPLPQRLPQPVLWVFAGVLLSAGSAAAAHAVFPTAARAWLQGVSGALMLFALLGLWSVLAAGALFGYLYPLFSVDLELSAAPERARWRSRFRVWGSGAWFLLLIACATWLPLIVAVACTAAAAAFLAVAVSIPCGHPLRFVWKTKDATGTPSSFSWSACLAGGALVVAAVGITIMFLATGDRIAGTANGDTRVTAFLGLCFTWAVAGATVYGLGDAALDVLLCRLRDPARPAPVRVHLAGEEAAGLGAVASELLSAGFRVARGRTRLRPMDVRVAIGEQPADDVTGDVPGARWPRSVLPEAAGDPELHRVLRRRAEILRRRELYRGLQLLFKRAAARGFREGQGFWIAPHLWFITHLSRDGEEEELWRIGPGYRRVLAREARHHMYAVMEGLELDLIFVEDGVGFRRFKRVLAMLFEHYDIFGGRRLEDERHFAGLPGVRVLLHDFQLEEPPRRSRYPEPDYEGVGRARILHVFRDRGGETESDLVPFDWSTLPSPRVPTLAPV